MTTITREQLIEDLKYSTQNASGMFEISEDTICALMSLLTAPPAPVVPDALPENDDEEGTDIDYMEPSEIYVLGRTAGWNACRAAMLQDSQPVSNRDELPLDYLQGHKDGLEWAAQIAEANHPQTGDWLYDDPVELAKAIRKGPDMPPVESGNSPVIPDGWVACSERLPPEGYEEDGGAVCYLVWHKNEVDCGPQYSISNVFFLRKHWEKNFTHWMPLPAAPHFRGIGNSSTNNCRENSETPTKCWCHTCRPVTISDMRFVVCPECGNKRCPHANDHNNACTGSNEPGQAGSEYPAAPRKEVK